ncbi:hypothetical protein [Paenibacillus lautus]|uniref:hypothetical protein n=1 Tax=Paenibacillus lautus TaxID=1401 RepID=UPI001C7DCBA4|nr:hypothetical protein [Paenibacillus lautus]
MALEARLNGICIAIEVQLNGICIASKVRLNGICIASHCICFVNGLSIRYLVKKDEIN